MTALDWPETDDEPPELGPTPTQAPTLTPLEAARADAAMTERRNVEWMMASDETPDFEILLAELVNRPAWHRQAACRGVDPDLFFPERGSRRYVEALAYCQDCPVRQECLASAFEFGERWTMSIWGGTTGRDRKGLRRGVA